MKKSMNPQSPEFRDLVASLTSTKLNLPLIPIGNEKKYVPEKINFTGHKDTDVLILMQLDDKELASVCSINKYLNSLCENETFWLNRILSNLKKTCEYVRKIEYFKEIDCAFEGNLVKLKDYFELTHYRQLNNYLNKFTKGEQLSIFLFIIHSPSDELYFEILLKKIYTVSKDELPNFVNYKKLISHLRQGIVEQYYHLSENKYYGSDIKFPGLTYKLLRKANSPKQDHEKQLRSINF